MTVCLAVTAAAANKPDTSLGKGNLQGASPFTAALLRPTALSVSKSTDLSSPTLRAVCQVCVTFDRVTNTLLTSFTSDRLALVGA